MFIPFGIASLYPEMRMTSVYVGQLMNFFATLLVFGIQDPISMRMVDAGSLKEAGTALLYGRVFSYVMAAAFFAFLLLTMR
jgi:riboflavin transporter FmnP